MGKYSPWINGESSWVNGEHNFANVRVEIDSSLSTVAIDYEYGMSYFLQGAEADEFIIAVCRRCFYDKPNICISANICEYAMENYL